MLYNLLNTLLLVGAIQGLIFSGFAFFSKKFRSLSTYLLGTLIFTFSYNLLQNYLVVSETIHPDRLFAWFYIPFSTLFLPLFYLYVKYYLYPANKLKKKHYLLFLPFLIAFTGSLIEKIGYNFNYTPQYEMFFNYFRFVQEVFTLIYSIILSILSYRLVRQFEKEQNKIKGQKSKIRYIWLKVITLILLGLCLYWIFPLYYELQFMPDKSLTPFYFLWVCLAVTIYLLGHIGLFQNGILKERMDIEAHKIKFEEEPTDNAIAQPDTILYKNDYISEFEKIVKHDKGFLQNDITLDSVAGELDLSKSYLSRIVNTELETSFNDYVNKLRIEEAVKYLNNPDFDNYNLLSIGLEAGFNSKSTFYNSFKKFKGMTPAQYRKNKK